MNNTRGSPFVIVLAVLLLGSLITGCAAPVPQSVEVPVTVEVQSPPVVQTVEVPVTVEVPAAPVVETVEVPVSNPTITFWSFENQPDRAQKTQMIIDRFREATGINVELVLIDQTSLGPIMAANYAAKTLPDVIFMPMVLAGGWYADGILSSEAATALVRSLGESTFSAGSLSMVAVPDGFAAVPSDGWGQLLVYRSDLFSELGLEPPDTYDRIVTAAKALEAAGYTGIMAGTDPGHQHTESTFEQFALANGVHLTDGAGDITLDTPAMVTAIATYTDLMANYGPKDTASMYNQTRAAYLAGTAGIVSWSPFILDEMAGLVDSALPNCPQCADDPAFIANNSDFVTAFSGPDGGPAQYGKVNYLGITTGADVDSAQAFVSYLLSDGYLDWLSVAPEGKFPMHRGTEANPTEYVDGWGKLDVGVNRKAPLTDFYSPEELQTIVQGADDLTALGYPEGEIELASAIYSEMLFPRAIGDVLEGVLTPEQAAAQIQAQAEELQASLAK